MLPADGDSGPGYMFYATPEQRANPEMYVNWADPRAWSGDGCNIFRPNNSAAIGAASHARAVQETLQHATQNSQPKEEKMTSKIARIFIFSFVFWLIVCSLTWVVGIEILCYFKGVDYHFGWNDVEIVAKLTLAISAAYAIIVLLGVRI